MTKASAGLLLWRRRGGELQVFLVHPGGPFWRNKDVGAWSIPKGEYPSQEEPLTAAIRETAEETGLSRLVLQGPIRVIDWHFRFRGRHIHKYCHFFLFESGEGEANPQVDEGITACQWRTLEEALDVLSYDNARGVLKRAGEMVRTLVAIGAGRPARGTD